MAIDLEAMWRGQLGEARWTHTAKRLRASREGEPVCDTTAAVVVWLPGQVVPEYAVPRDDLAGDPGWVTGLTDLAEHALADHVVVPFGDVDWLEEEEPVIGHPHDPYHRIDILRSSRHVQVEVGGTLVAETDRPVAVFETHLPVRWYLPAEAVRTELLHESDRRTTCAYKGHASYLSTADESGRDIVWVYRSPLPGAEPLRDLLCFYAERTVTLVDGERDPGYTGAIPL